MKTFELSNKTIELSEEEARELFLKLSNYFSGAKIVYPIPSFPPSYPYWPPYEITYSNKTGDIR